MKSFREYFEQRVKINEDDWDIISSKFKEVKVPAKTILLQNGKVENYLYFLTKGIVRYTIPKAKDGKTFDFSFEKEFAGAYDSFVSRSPSYYDVEALTAAVLWRISYNDLQDVFEYSALGNTVGRLAAESFYLKKAQCEKSQMLQTAQKRYVKFCQEHPTQVDEIPMKVIASYLGITQPALSRVVKSIS